MVFFKKNNIKTFFNKNDLNYVNITFKETILEINLYGEILDSKDENLEFAKLLDELFSYYANDEILREIEYWKMEIEEVGKDVFIEKNLEKIFFSMDIELFSLNDYNVIIKDKMLLLFNISIYNTKHIYEHNLLLCKLLKIIGLLNK